MLLSSIIALFSSSPTPTCASFLSSPPILAPSSVSSTSPSSNTPLFSKEHGVPSRPRRKPAAPLDYPHLDPRRPPRQGPVRRASNSSDADAWVIRRVYQGKGFFDQWNFASYPDPTHGQVNYVTREWANASDMVYTNEQGQAIMEVDNWSHLTQGQSRNSVRIESTQLYEKGLFILDVEHAPWGCGVWPAWWTVGPAWPANGEIDIIEGVHDNVHNQVAFHTADGCYLNKPNATTPAQYNATGEVLSTVCNGLVNSNSGCAAVDPSQASYGTQFNVLKGGIFAMLWDDDSVRIWFFHRAAIPTDLLDNSPQPSQWGTPVAYLGDSCDINKHFHNHSIIFDITFCGDWAGSSYISSGCPGTCSDRIMDPNNFMNASWTINSLQVYRNAKIGGNTVGSSVSRTFNHTSLLWMATLVSGLVFGLLLS